MVRFGCYCSSVGNVDGHGIFKDSCALNGWDCWGEYQQWHELHQWDWSWVLRISKGPKFCSLSPCRFPAAEQSQMLVVAKEVYVPTVDDIPSVWNSIGGWLVTENWATSGLTYGFQLSNDRDAISEATYKIYVCFCWVNILPWTVRMCQVSNVAFVDNDLDALQIAGATPKWTAVCMDLRWKIPQTLKRKNILIWFPVQLFLVPLLKIKVTGWKIHHEWRWISYLTWGFSNVTLVFRGVCFGLSNKLDKSWSVFWRTNDSRCKKRMKIVEAQVMHSCTL